MRQANTVQSQNAKTELEPVSVCAEKWLQLYGDALFRLAFRLLRNREWAEDAVQETLLAALKSRTGFRGQASEKTWLMAILRHKIVDIQRLRLKEMFSDSVKWLENAGIESASLPFNNRGGWTETLADWGDPCDCLSQQQLEHQLEECIDALPTRVSQVLLLKLHSGNPVKQLSNDLGISTGHFNVLLYRARMALRNCLDRKWGR